MDNKNNLVGAKNENSDRATNTIDGLNTTSPLEVTEINNKRIDFEYPNEPVGLHLANKYFEIASFVNDETKEEEYYLIDPNQLNNGSQATSYKIIEANIPLPIGRDSDYGFDLPNTVSKNHARITRVVDNNGDRISVEDLGSTNGTTLWLPVKESKPTSPENKEIFIDDKNQITADFKRFAVKYQLYMDETYAQKDRNQLIKIIYNKFYSLDETDTDNFGLSEDEIMGLDEELYVEQKNLYSQNIHNGIAPGEINMKDSNAWYFYTQGRIESTPELGRLYMNIKLDKAVDFMRDLLLSLGQNYQDISTQVKMPNQASKQTICRKDKMVMYFYDKDEKAVLECIEKLYHTHEDYFNENGIPRFSEALLDSGGQEMNGVGFGQEPYEQRTSFGVIRSNILADIFWDAKGMGHQVSDNNFNFQASYIDACRRHNVDPNSPAFNLNDNRFKEIKNRLYLKKAAA